MATTISMQTQIVGGPGDRRRDGQIAVSCVCIYIFQLERLASPMAKQGCIAK